MTRLYWFLRGYVQFVFTGGFAEDFINALGELGITLPGLQRQGSDLRGVCSVGTYMQLHKAARQAGGRVRITARRGLPFSPTTAGALGIADWGGGFCTGAVCAQRVYLECAGGGQ